MHTVKKDLGMGKSNPFFTVCGGSGCPVVGGGGGDDIRYQSEKFVEVWFV
jgi:hypothetical protein